MTTPRLAVLALLALLALLRPAAAEVMGGYFGIDSAAGMRLDFAEGRNGLDARLTWPDGTAFAFEATPLPTGAEAIVDAPGGKALYVATAEPLGLVFTMIPLGEDDLPLPAGTVAYLFLRDGVTAPPRPARYVPPPDGPGGTIDPRAFVESYSFWPSKNVAWGYEMVRGRYRTLIRLHPVVQADILWKLCRANAAPAALAEALRGQGVSCDDVLAAFGRMLRPGGSIEPFNAFRRDVEAQKAALVEAIHCSLDYRRNDPDCRRAGARVAVAAASLETVKTVLERY